MMQNPLVQVSISSFGRKVSPQASQNFKLEGFLDWFGGICE